jgi:ribose-phosphate pyrophosphokinase
MHLFSGTSHPALGSMLAKELKTSPGKIILKRFSCGECYVKYEESVRGKEVYILSCPGHDPDKDLVELFLMCQAAKLSFANRVHVILPNFPYSRQDRVSQPREPISAKLIAHLLEGSGADHVITLTLHSDQIQGFFSIPVDVLDARQIFASYFQKKNLRNPVIVSPDAGGAKQAKKFADTLGADLAIMHKTRSEHSKAQIMEVVGDVKGHTCILYDDMIDTGGSMISAAQALIQRGAEKDIYVAAAHPIFSGDAISKFKNAGFHEVVVTDSLPITATFPSLNVLPIAPLLANVIRHIERGESVTEIYNEE